MLSNDSVNSHGRIKTIWLHLRLPFSYFLLPVYFFALSQSASLDVFNNILTFISLHFFIYPASNSYNSYMDKDVGSIGALRNPPPVTRDIYLSSIVLDTIGLLLMAVVNFKLAMLTIPYILVSKAYSWNKIRLKKYPVTGWLAVILFQGGYTFLLVNMASENNFSIQWITTQKIQAMLLATLLIGAYYPLTQIYQHAEDRQRGDITISSLLGIRGTFIFTAIVFILAVIIAWFYFQSYYSLKHFMIFQISLLPALIYFFYWLFLTFKNKSAADFNHTMRMTFISSTCLLVGFVILLWIK